jgi:serralysin
VATAHDAAGPLVASLRGFRTGPRIEAGTFHHVWNGQLGEPWVWLRNLSAHAKPVAIFGPLSDGGGDGVTMRVAGLDLSGVTAKVDEWDCHDGTHSVAESAGLLLANSSNFNLDGLKAQGIRIEGVTDQWSRVSFQSGWFAAPPVVVAQPAGTANSSTLVCRIKDVTASGFSIRLQKQESLAGAIAPEAVHAFAIQAGAGTSGKIRAGLSPVGSAGALISFGTELQNPVFLAAANTFNEADPFVLRFKNLAGASVSLRIQEEQSADPEIGHAAESVGWIAVGE